MSLNLHGSLEAVRDLLLWDSQEEILQYHLLGKAQ
jgi:hypothetical protein